MKCSVVLLAIIVLLFCGCAGRSAGMGAEHYLKRCDIRSDYDILDIDHLERLECDTYNAFYIRSIIAYHEFTDIKSRMRYRSSAATYLNGIYKYDGKQYMPICEIPGDRKTNGYGGLHKRSSGGGEFNMLLEWKTYYKHFHNGKRKFFVELVFSPYRGEATTVYVFDLDDLSKPILNLTTGRIAKLEELSPGKYNVEVIRWPEPNNHFLLVYDDNLKEYIVQDN